MYGCVLSLTLSMVTGDSSALVWVLVAETTISSAMVVDKINGIHHDFQPGR